MTDWIAVGLGLCGAQGFALCGASVRRSVTADTTEQVLADLGPSETVVRIGEGAASHLPAPVLPQQGHPVGALEQASPPDVISAWVRLWVAGVLAVREHWDGVVCATQGDVTHWLHVSADEVVSAQSVLTPRLRQALGGAETVSEVALADTMSRPERLAAHLRQAEVAGDGAAITGHLLGAELAATKPYWLGQEVVVISADAAGHVAGLQAQGVQVSAVEPDTALEVGLGALARALDLAE